MGLFVSIKGDTRVDFMGGGTGVQGVQAPDAEAFLVQKLWLMPLQSIYFLVKDDRKAYFDRLHENTTFFSFYLLWNL